MTSSTNYSSGNVGMFTKKRVGQRASEQNHVTCYDFKFISNGWYGY